MKKALSIYLAYQTASAFCYRLVFTTSMLYFIDVARLDPLQLVLVGTALESSIFLFEIPTGVVADVYSRRLSVIIGMFIISAGFILEGLIPRFGPIVVSQVIWGLGYTFTSGAGQAWISDEIGEEESGPAFMRAAQLEQFGALAGVGVAILLGNIAIRLPILAGGALFLLIGLILIRIMPEQGFHSTSAANHNNWQHMADTLRSGLRMARLRPALAGILTIGLLFGLYSEGYDRLSTAFLLERFTFPTWGGLTTVTWLGLISAATMLLTGFFTGLVQRRIDLRKTRKVALAMYAFSGLLVAALFLFPLSRTFPLAIGLMLTIDILRQTIYPLYTAWVNHRLDPQVRATVLSMSSQVDALGQIGGGPITGLVAGAAGIPAGLLTSAALLAPVLLLLGFQLRGMEGD